jgi:hypothetical protein
MKQSRGRDHNCGRIVRLWADERRPAGRKELLRLVARRRRGAGEIDLQRTQSAQA